MLRKAQKKINSTKWRIERLTDNEDVLLTLKWDGLEPTKVLMRSKTG